MEDSNYSIEAKDDINCVWITKTNKKESITFAYYEETSQLYMIYLGEGNINDTDLTDSVIGVIYSNKDSDIESKSADYADEKILKELDITREDVFDFAKDYYNENK
ncbi:MAG: hypothetical protein ACK5LC_05720 [Coprobacillaceae bacterium]